MLKFNRSSGIEKHGITTLLLIMILALSILYLVGCGANSTRETQDGSSSQYGGANAPKAGQALNSTVKSVSESASLKESDQEILKVSSSSIDRKIIQNAEISLQVKNVPLAADKILDLSKQNGGYTVNSHIYRKEERVSANLAIKVPQQKLSSIIAAITAYGEVNDKVISSEDVTEEYYDSEARLKVLTAKETRLLSLLNKTSNITDIISIENELSQTRSDIEVLTGRLKYLSNATDYSLVNINLEQTVPGAVKAPQGTLGKAAQGLINSLNQLIQFASNLVVLLFVLLPWAFVLALLVLLARFIHKQRKAHLTKK